MRRTFHAGLTVGVVVALAAAFFGVASAATSQHEAFKACSTSSGALGLIKSGRCAKGDHKVTVSAQGPRGPAGPFPTSLPSGKTETGAFLIASGSATPIDFGQASFSFPLKSDISSAHAPQVENTEKSSDPKHCPGSYDKPSAARGYFCLYLAVAGNIDLVRALTLTSHPGASKAGAILVAEASDDSKELFASGSWALTAP